MIINLFSLKYFEMVFFAEYNKITDVHDRRKILDRLRLIIPTIDLYITIMQEADVYYNSILRITQNFAHELETVNGQLSNQNSEKEIRIQELETVNGQLSNQNSYKDALLSFEQFKKFLIK